MGESDVTQLLGRWGEGDEAALAELLPLVETELHRMAHRHMSRERGGHVLQTTALVNEVYLRIAGQQTQWQNRAQFFALAARIMRRILIDHARKRSVDRRGGGAVHVALDEVAVVGDERAGELVALDTALDELAAVDPRKARVIELRFFGGLTGEEIAEVLGIDERTVKRDWKTARAWLHQRMAALAD